MTHHRDVSVMTASGVILYPFRTPEEIAPSIRIYDIAHHLAHLCRYTGATREFYSVAQHSVLCADLTLDRFHDQPDVATRMFMALMHDGPEYVMNDLAGPIKCVATWREEGLAEPLSLDAYHRGESNLAAAIALACDLPDEKPDWLDRVDRDLLAAEKYMLMPTGQLGERPDLPGWLFKALEKPLRSGEAKVPFLDACTKIVALRQRRARAGALPSEGDGTCRVTHGSDNDLRERTERINLD